MMTANKIFLALSVVVILIGCNTDKYRNEMDALNILNLTVQTIHSEININSCYRRVVNDDCQCEEAFSFKADSIIIVNEIFDISPPELYLIENCNPIEIDSSLWSKINYYKKINLSSLGQISLERKDYKTLYFLIHQPWKCEDKIFIHVSMNGPKYYSGHLISLKRDVNDLYKLDKIELMGFN